MMTKRIMKKFAVMMTVLAVTLQMNVGTIWAYSYSFENCPNSGSYVGSNFNYNKAYNNHTYYPGSNYNCWSDVSGGRYVIFYESWNCTYCGKLISKSTVYDVSSPASFEENLEKEAE